MKVKVDKRMLPMKAHYFFYNAGTAPVVPFMPTLARQLGFSSVVVGTIYTVLPMVGMLVKPIFGAIADKFQKRKMMFLICQLITAVAFLGIKFIKPINHSANVQFHCNAGVSDLQYCTPSTGSLDSCLLNNLEGNETNSDMLTCTLTCTVNSTWMAEAICRDWQNNDTTCNTKRTSFEMIADIPMQHIENPSAECLLFVLHMGHMIENDKMYPIRCPKQSNNALYFKTDCSGHCSDGTVMQLLTAHNEINVLDHPEFWFFVGCMVLSWAAMAAVVSLADTICFQMLGEKHHLYGNQRLWGAIGWGIFAFLSGFLVDEMSRGQLLKDYSIVFYMMICLIGLDLIFSSKIEHKQTGHSSQILKDIGVLFMSPVILIFFGWCIVVGLCTALIWNFLFWHLEELADADPSCNHNEWMKTLQGLVSVIQTFGGELPFLFLSGWVLQSITHIHAMSLVLFGFAVRFMLYSILTNPWWVLPIELMQGVTFGIFYATMASYASLVAPPGTEATLQGLVGAIFEGIGVSSGSFIAGYLMKSVGGAQTFRIFGYLAIVFFMVHVALHKLMEWFPCGRGKDDSRDIVIEEITGINLGNGAGDSNGITVYKSLDVNFKGEPNGDKK